jgi:hypothetical protein
MMPRPKMPRGVHFDRANYPACVAVRVVDSKGVLRAHCVMDEAFAALVPDREAVLWATLDTIDPVADSPSLRLMA